MIPNLEVWTQVALVALQHAVASCTPSFKTSQNFSRDQWIQYFCTAGSLGNDYENHFARMTVFLMYFSWAFEWETSREAGL